MSRSPLLPGQTRQLALLSPEERWACLCMMSEADLLRYDADFESWLHGGQRPPQSEGWRTWLMLAGRGYGKTRAGAEWITRLANQHCPPVRIALVGATMAEVRAVMVEGESGLLAVGRDAWRPTWEPSLGRLRWRGGSEAFVYSAENPEGLRGPQHHFAWCDELAKWSHADATWDNLQMGLRGGERPRALVTTTPRSVPILTRIGTLPDTVTSGGRTSDNANLPETFLEAMAATYGGTRLGRQELDGELLEDVEGALWTRSLLEACRCRPVGASEAKQSSGFPTLGWIAASPSAPRKEGGEYRRVVIGVDPPASAHGDACGIVAVGLGHDGLAYVLSDHSAGGLSPEGWARKVAAAAEMHGADKVVAEANNGGEMVRSVLRAANSALPVTLVHASRGKSARAEPVAMLYESGKVRHAGVFPELEDELAGMTIGGGYEGPGRSPGVTPRGGVAVRLGMTRRGSYNDGSGGAGRVDGAGGGRGRAGGDAQGADRGGEPDGRGAGAWGAGAGGARRPL